jgi:hypothetical protein
MLVCDNCQRLFYRLIDCQESFYCAQCLPTLELATAATTPELEAAVASEYQAVMLLEDSSNEVGEIICEALVVRQPVLN